ncbi:MAG TPA: hypothetical protein VI685_20915 [Candidatus Angelobacter sp.]
MVRFPTNPKTDTGYILRALEQTLHTKRKADVECAMILWFHFGFPDNTGPILCKLILEDWHTQHENMAAAMQKLRDPRTVDCLYQTALARFPYLEYDEAHALAVKCLWALSDINTHEACEKLKLLTQSKNKIIRENAERLLNRSSRTL